MTQKKTISKMGDINEKLDKILAKRMEEGSLRSLKPNDEGLVDFCSNDYLGFARSQKLKEKIKQYAGTVDNTFNIGATGSRLISGNSLFAEHLESHISEYHNAEAGLLFNSGFDANIGLFSCVPQRGDTILYDEFVHASVRDGIRLSHADSFSFRHNDVYHVKELLNNKARGDVFIAVESVYSMDGDSAPLKELAELCREKGANLIVDEAHATGVFGELGKGMVCQLGIEKHVFARMHTFGKALGCHGAIVLGSNTLKNFLINYARSFIYTTFLPYHTLISIKCAYNMLSESNEETDKLNSNILLFKENIKKPGSVNIIDSLSPIQCVIIQGNKEVQETAKQIRKEGFNVKAIMSPTVPAGKERLRIIIHSFNTGDEITEMADLLNNIIKS